MGLWPGGLGPRVTAGVTLVRSVPQAFQSLYEQAAEVMKSESFRGLFSVDVHIEDGTNVKGFSILLEKMQKEQLGVKKPISGFIKIAFGLGVAALVGYALISGGI